MRQFSYIASYTDNYSGQTSEEGHIVSFKQNSMIWASFFLSSSLKWVSIQFCCNPSNGYGIMRADGFYFSSLWLSHPGPLQWFKPKHICQGHFYCRALQLGCSTLKHIYIVQHSQGPGCAKGSLTNLSSISPRLESFCRLNTERWFVTGPHCFHHYFI